jgi:hypothetical protein
MAIATGRNLQRQLDNWLRSPAFATRRPISDTQGLRSPQALTIILAAPADEPFL